MVGSGEEGSGGGAYYAGSSGGGSGGGNTGGGSPYRVQRHAANIRERKRMLRSAPGEPTHGKDTVKM